VFKILSQEIFAFQTACHRLKIMILGTKTLTFTKIFQEESKDFSKPNTWLLNWTLLLFYVHHAL